MTTVGMNKTLLLAAAEEGAVSWETLANELIQQISDAQAADVVSALELEDWIA